MKTTLNLPDSLIKRVKLRALHKGRKINDEVADLLRAGLEARRPSRSRGTVTSPKVVKDAKTGLPVIQCKRAASRGRELTPERVAEILSSQEAEWARDSG